MKILIAPDSFKGSLTASEFCSIAQSSLLHLIPHAHIDLLPMADGGEGTTEALMTALSGRKIRCQVTGPMGNHVDAFYGYCENKKLAFMEMASASGLPLVASQMRNPLAATSYGTGELMVHALNQGAEHIVIGLGGSATNDGGLGMLQALGFKFLGRDGNLLPQGALALKELNRIDSTEVHPRLLNCHIEAACDVVNPLLGPNGATYTYGPQKGADEKMLHELEQRMTYFADVIEGFTHQKCRDLPGAGAAGGMGFALVSLCRAKIKSGFEMLADLYQLPQRLRQTHYDWLITGEGQVDNQSFQGKLLGRLMTLAHGHQIPVLVFCGSLALDFATCQQLGPCHIFPIITGPCKLEQAITDAPKTLFEALQRVFSLITFLKQPKSKTFL